MPLKRISHAMSLPANLSDLTMTIKEEEAVEDILKEIVLAKKSINDDK
jgi:hypothetical protein